VPNGDALGSGASGALVMPRLRPVPVVFVRVVLKGLEEVPMPLPRVEGGGVIALVPDAAPELALPLIVPPGLPAAPTP
jgi:hypothetical protein